MPVQDNRRTDSIRVRLSGDMMDRFEQLAVRYGMPPATLGAFAIAKFVQSEEMNAGLARSAVMDMASKAGESVMDEAFLERILTGALRQAALPLDDSQPGANAS